MAVSEKTKTVMEMAREVIASKTLAQNVLLQQDLYEENVERVAFTTSVREIIEYSRPDLSKYLDETQRKGEKRTGKMYTSKPLTALETASDAFVGNVFNPGGWFRYYMQQLPLNQVDFVQAWLQQLKDHFNAVYINSGFYEVLPPITMDAFSIGDGIAYLGENKETSEAYFEYCELLACWFTRDLNGSFNTFHRKMNYPAITAFRRWGSELSDNCIRAAYENPSQEFTFIHAVYDRKSPMLDRYKFAKERPYIELWIEEDSDNNEMMDVGPMSGILEQTGYHTMPFMDWPYWLKSNENIGRGPIGSSIVSVKRLHAEHKTAMTKAQRDAAPPLKGTMSLKGRTRLGPDGMTWIKGNEDIAQVYGGGGGYASQMDHIERTETQLEEALHIDTFLMHSLATKRMTIPEFMERAGEKAAALAPRLGFMDKYFLKNVHNRLWDIEERNGRIPPPPQQLVDAVNAGQVNGKVNVRYSGHLRQAQEQMLTQRRIGGNMSMVSTVAQFNPQAAADKIHVSRTVEHILDEGDWWQDSIVPEAVIEENNRIRQKMALENAKSEQENLDSQTAKNMTSALREVEAGEEE